MRSSTDVLVAGAGPVGLTLALELQRARPNAVARGPGSLRRSAGGDWPRIPRAVA